METTLPYWGEITSSVDWCEPNYSHSYYIAEFYNTLSSLFIIFMGELGYYHNFELKKKDRLVFRLVSFVGLGSFLFHMTLKHEFQMLDEVPMLLCAALFLSICMDYINPKNKLLFNIVLFSATLIASLFIMFSRGTIEVLVFRMTFNILILFTIVIGFINYSNDASNSYLFKSYVVSALFATFIWHIDTYFCHHLLHHPLLKLIYFHYHSLWHIFSSYSIYCGFMFNFAYYYQKTKKIDYKYGILPVLKDRKMD